MSFISFKDIVREYKVGDSIIKAVDEVSFNIPKGNFNVILGQSGAGKTTVLNLLGGMDMATSGTITVAGEEFRVCQKKKLRLIEEML